MRTAQPLRDRRHARAPLHIALIIAALLVSPFARAANIKSRSPAWTKPSTSTRART
jgi:hypothetical protein